VTTTSAAIRDIMIAETVALVPSSVAGARFKAHREDRGVGGVTVEDWSLSRPNELRVFSIRDTGERTPPTVLLGGTQRERVTFAMAVGYPQTNAYGPDAERDRDDVMDQDQRQIEAAVMDAANYTIDTTPLFLPGESPRWDRRDLDGMVLLVGAFSFEFWRTVP
jgi:hypothetical protein